MSNKKSVVPELRFPGFGKDWVYEPFSEIYSFLTTNSFSRAKLNYEKGNVRNIHYGDIHTKFSTLFDVSTEDVPYVNPDISLRKIKKETYCEVGDIVFADASEDLDDVGKSIEIINLGKEKLLAGLHTLLARQNSPQKLIIGFGGYLFKSPGIRSQIKREAQGAKVLGISGTRLLTINVFYPDNELEQQKIADCLSSLDALIAAHRDKLDALRAHKKGLMQNLFPQEGERVPRYRFEGFVGEWEEQVLGNLIDVKGRIGYRGYTRKDIVNKGEGAISMSPSNIDENGNLNYEKSTYISWHKYEESPEIMLKDGFTVLVKTGSSFGKAAYIADLKEKATINPQLVVMKPETINPRFLFLMVSNASIQKQIGEAVVGGAIPTLSQASLAAFKVVVPKLEEQQKIADCLSSVDELIAAQADRIEQLQEHKRGLMQGLFPKVD
ncbi:hypothetical protein IX84_07905 [Phaeodactylibacter xiamenensis]|uniref:Type I restriction modification DNA specificity domain-containing protein n=2 Tax=Phaeodactylibacter xiamenensis TaxID=1524460 RepID=A0A098SC24_9BACT|nr:hypothetical protein IX84_07905 [Phaeodactylibacter xiamenensis]